MNFLPISWIKRNNKQLSSNAMRTFLQLVIWHYGEYTEEGSTRMTVTNVFFFQRQQQSSSSTLSFESESGTFLSFSSYHENRPRRFSCQCFLLKAGKSKASYFSVAKIWCHRHFCIFNHHLHCNTTQFFQKLLRKAKDSFSHLWKYM